MKKYLFLSIVMAIFGVAMLGRVIAYEKASRETIVRYVDFKVYDPVYIGVEKGFFSRHGVNVQITGSILGGPTAIQAVGSGSAEAGLSSIMAIINANASGVPIVGVSDIQSALANQPLEVYYVRKDSDIKSISDLRGKRFAVNLWKSSFHYTAMLALERAGLKESDVQFVLLPFDKQAQALESGQVDVIGLMEPYAAFMRSRGTARQLFTANDVFGTRQFSLHFVNREWARKNPAAACAFVSGIVESIAWIETHQNEAKKIIAKHTGIDERFVPDYHFQRQGRVVMSDIQYWIDELKRRGDLKANSMKDSDIATNYYNRAVIK